MEVDAFYSRLTRRHADLLLVFLKNPMKMSIGQLQKKLEEEKMYFADYRITQRNVEKLVLQKLVTKEAIDARRHVYKVSQDFFNAWRKERLRLKLEHIKVERDMKTKISIDELYDESTRKYFLL